MQMKTPFYAGQLLPLVLVVFTTGQQAKATSVCDKLAVQVEELAQLRESSDNWVTNLNLPMTQDACEFGNNGTYGKSFHCKWPYDYRDPNAEAEFVRFDQALSDCFGTDAKLTPDQGVNHPDSYQLSQFSVGSSRVSVSLKDKASLGKTYIFLRLESLETE